MKGGAFGFSRREIIWFSVILLSSLVIAVFCLVRIINKFYSHSEDNAAHIRRLSSEVLHLQEVNMHSVNIQRSSLNLIIYSNNKTELESIEVAIEKNRDTLWHNLVAFSQRAVLPGPMAQDLVTRGSAYLAANQEYRQMLRDSLRKSEAADFNVSKMRPALRKFTDLIRSASMTLTSDIQKTAEVRLNLFTFFEFWLLVLLIMPYLYFFYRFVRLFIKVLLMDTNV